MSTSGSDSEFDGFTLEEASEAAARADNLVRSVPDESDVDISDDDTERYFDSDRGEDDFSDDDIAKPDNLNAERTVIKYSPVLVITVVPVAKQPSPQADILRYVDDADFVYQDFAKRGHTTEIPTFRALDYSWEDQGFSLANRLYSEIGNLLDEKFTTTYNLTYNTMGQKLNVDTSAFRRSIWNYIHCLFGIRHDDYNYSEVNQLLERPLKNYIKIVTCFPERVSKKDYDSYMREFEHSEKVHINLMLLEARVQGELLYALRAIMKYMT